MSATFATESHHAIASLEAVNGGVLTRRTGWAPLAARSCRKARTFARYCVVVAVHGVDAEAPNSSLTTTSPVEQPPLAVTAVWYRFSAAASSVEGSAGVPGVPTSLLNRRSKLYVAAPRARASAP